MSNKTYVGNGKLITTQHGHMLKLSFSKADLAVMENHLNEKGYVNINCNKRKTDSEWGHTHSMHIDTWKPDPQKVTQVDNNHDSFDDDIPF